MIQFILALCGLPASGKSALANSVRERMNSETVIVRTDDWRDNSYYKNWRPEKEAPVRAAALNKVKELITQGKNVIHDDTNYYASMRHDLFKIALDNKCAFAIIHVTTPVEVALKWNHERPGTRIPDRVIRRINERFDMPGRRYLWDNAMMDVNMVTEDIDEVVSEVVRGIAELEAVKEPDPQLVTNSEFEKLDVETRRVVSAFLEEHPDLRGNRKVSEIRRNVLSRASQNQIPLKGLHELLHRELMKLL